MSRKLFTEKETSRRRLICEVMVSAAPLTRSLLQRTQQCVIQPACCSNVLHPSTASLLTRPLSAPYITPEQQGDGTGTHSPPCCSLATLQRASRDKQSHVSPLRPSPRDVCKHAEPCQAEAKPWQATSRTSWGLPDDSPRFIVRCHKVFFSLLSSDFNHRPSLRVVLLLAVSNHSPAVWFIQAASEISVKCSA